MERKIEIKKSTLIQIALVMMFIGIFVFSYYFREAYMPNYLRGLNPISLLSIFILVFTSGIKLNKRNIAILLMIALLTILFINTQIINNKELIETIKVLLALIAPIILLTLELDKKNFEVGFKRFINWYNIFIIILLVFGIIDAFTSNMTAKFFATIFNNERFAEMANEVNRTRYLSFMGHPLYNAQLFITYYILNNMSSKYIVSNTKPIFVTLISIIGVALTGGKTGMVLIIFAILVFSFRNIKVFIPQIILIVCALNLGIFSSTIERFLSGSLTTGRIESLQTVMRYKIMPIKFINGYGYGSTFIYNYYISWASAAFEFPITMFALEYGVLFTIIFHLIFIAIPALIFIKRKQLLICIGYFILFLDVSTYNGLGLAQDHMMLFCFITYVIFNLSKYIYYYENN